ncbi:peptidoglycan DD-metalloendopeptidase family protein [Methylosoma difficile]
MGIGLAFVAASGHAKTSHAPSKKHPGTTAKREKPNHTHKLVSHVAHSKTKQITVALSKGKLKNTKSHKNKFSKHIIAKHSKPIVATHRAIAAKAEQVSEPSNRIHSLITTQAETDFATVSVPTDLELFEQITSTHGVVQTTLYRAGQNAGLSEDLLNQLTGVFAWDIDFANNLRPGDQFTAVFGTNENGHEEILAAEFVNRGRILTAIRYKDADGNINYYSPEGKTMRKSFLSTPVAYDHISSHFDSNRMHPILNRIRAHKGVDYAARTGTPVKAAGDGMVSFLGRKGGYGQVLILKHGEHYETVYAHLSRFKQDLLEGDNVRQGQVIGYVGQTGLATGPHLHYEFRVDGMHRNPESVTQDNAKTINRQLLADFKNKAQPLLAQLYQTKSRYLFAKNLNKAN